MSFNFGDKACLLMENGRVFEGRSFGAKGTAFGEAVFCTAAGGYQQILTDPCYFGQLVVHTFPITGSYGVNDEDFESAKPALSGYIVREWCDNPSNFRMNDNIDSFMKKQGIIGLHSIDTRALTRMLRDEGSMRGVITTEDISVKKDELLAELKAFKIANAVSAVSCTEKHEYKAEKSSCKTVLYDFGVRRSTIAELNTLGCDVTVVPASTKLEDVLAMKPDGIVLSEGSGDPMQNTEIIAELAKLADKKIATLGIGLGHQLMAVAAGAGKTQKMKCGHHGSNQPVKDTESDKVYVTSQNHCYEVAADSIDSTVAEMSHVNVNDGSCEGLRYKNAPIITVQFQPDSSGSVLDTSYVLDRFVELMKKHSMEGK